MKKIFLSAFVAVCSIAALAQTRIANTQTPEEKLNDQYCTGLFKSTEGTIFDLLNNSTASSYFNVLNWLEGRVAGLHVYTLRNGNRIPVIRGQQASIYVDEVQVTPSYLNSLSSSDIAMIKVIKSAFLGGFNGGGSAIAIYTIGTEEDDESDGGK